MQVSLVLWDGNVGGAEKLTAELAGALRAIGVDARVVFVRDPKTLSADLDRLSVPYVSFGARRVEQVLRRPRRFARLVRAHGPHGALLPTVGHLAPALRIGGYRAPLVAMEHGFLLLARSMSRQWRLARLLERRLSAPFVDAEVAVSDFMLEQARQAPHARRVERIRNGIDTDRYGAESARSARDRVIGCAGRLVPGKGIETLLRAFEAVVRAEPATRLRIAGDGPERDRVEELIRRHRFDERAELVGVVDDMPAFWREVDVAVMPSSLPESFGMAALEAMASRRPIVATVSGGVPELIDDGVTGRLVPRDDPDALAAALLEYVRDPELRRAHGSAGRERCERDFSIHRCAREYADLVAEIGGVPAPASPRAERALEEVNA
jgi:glycosyltransferase involved in cell wall biosynthesis